MGSNPSKYEGENLPVEKVTWYDCQEFCKKTGLSLPTEAQWEYACRAGTTGPYGGTGNLDDMGWYKNNSSNKVHPVGEKQPNHFGLYDMHGNVCEWCEDVYDSEFYRKPEAAKKDPVSTSGSVFRPFRGGGACRSDATDCRSAYRLYMRPPYCGSLLGLRVCWSIR
jgi:formylglycine-generating enzyme required for sulfatase activity